MVANPNTPSPTFFKTLASPRLFCSWLAPCEVGTSAAFATMVRRVSAYSALRS